MNATQIKIVITTQMRTNDLMRTRTKSRTYHKLLQYFAMGFELYNSIERKKEIKHRSPADIFLSFRVGNWSLTTADLAQSYQINSLFIYNTYYDHMYYFNRGLCWGFYIEMQIQIASYDCRSMSQANKKNFWEIITTHINRCGNPWKLERNNYNRAYKAAHPCAINGLQN